MNRRINHLTSAFNDRTPQSARGVAQLAVAALGVLVILWSLVMVAVTFALMSPSESGFAEGLVFIVFGLYALVGFVILSLGLLIPQLESDGIHFSRQQRRLLGYGVIAPIGGVVAIPIGATVLPPLSGGVTSLLVVGLLGLLLSGPFAILLAIATTLRY